MISLENKNTLETCKNPRPTSGWSELTKSYTTSTMNFHMAYFSWIPKNNARLKLSCKFGESKCNPYWHITLTTSYGMNHVLNEHKDFDQFGSFTIPSEIVLYQSHPESLVNQNEILSELLSTSWSGNNYVHNEHEDVDRYGSFAIPSETRPTLERR